MAREFYQLPDEDVGRSWAPRRIVPLACALLAAGLVVALVVYIIAGLLRGTPRLAPISAPTTFRPEQVREPERSSPAQPRAGDQARAIIADLRERAVALDFPGLYARAEQFKEDGLLADAYLLHFFAAREGYAPSAMVLGSAFDPNHHSETVSLMEEPNPAQAFKWYTKAAAGGASLAQERLDELREWLERAARAGDPEARRILMQWR